MGSRSWIAAGFVFLIFASIYLVAVVELDNTNIGTTNGLWKSPAVRGWEKGTSHKLDSGEWLYLPLYGLLCRLIPDAWVSYGTHAPAVTFRKMALLNGLFGGVASAVVFLLAMRFLKSLPAAGVAALAHGCAAFVILNGINSEDIVPAYTFFLLTALCLFAFLDGERVGYLLGASLCCAMLTLLHWTLMIPALAGVIAVGLLVRRRVWMLPLFFGVFLVVLKLFALGFGPWKTSGDWALAAPPPWPESTPFRRIESIREIVYPSKAAPNGYLGFRWNKVVSASIGIGNYFLGGKNIADNRVAFADPNIVGWMRISWLFTIVTVGALVWAAIFRGSTRMPAVFGLVVFAMGEMEHLYSQPQDPQSQIEPMFATILGVIVILEAFGRVRFLAVALGAAFFLEGDYNARLMMASRGEDSRYMKQTNELAQVFPPDDTVLVSQGWEEWNTWVFAETFDGNRIRYVTRNIGLVNGFIQELGATPEQAADSMAKKIDAALAEGHRVVANVVWVGSREDFANSLTTLASVEDARIYADRLYGTFHAGRSWDTSVGRFVELRK